MEKMPQKFTYRCHIHNHNSLLNKYQDICRLFWGIIWPLNNRACVYNIFLNWKENISQKNYWSWVIVAQGYLEVLTNTQPSAA